MAGPYVTKINNGSQVLTVRDPEAIHSEAQGDGAFNPAANIAFTGADSFSQSPTVPTVETSDNSAKAASTAFVKNAIAAGGGGGGGGGTSDHHYAIVTKTTATCTLDDRSVNILDLGSATSATISMPPAVSGKARDLWLVLTTTASGTKTYTLSGGTFYGENDSTFELDVGSDKYNLLVFTEFGTNRFMVSRRCPGATATSLH